MRAIPGFAGGLPACVVLSTCIVLTAYASVANAQHFFSAGEDPGGDLAFQAALPAGLIELDLDGFASGEAIAALGAGPITITPRLLRADGSVAMDGAEIFRSALLDYPMVMDGGTLLNRSSGLVTARLELVFSEPVAGFGAFLYDDGPPSHAFRLLAIAPDGTQTPSPSYDTAPGWAVEGFMGVIAPEGIASVVFECSADYPFEIDHLQIGLRAPACPADLDGDGVLTLFDFLAFQNLFDTGDPRADFDGDGALTLFDFLAFQNAFDAGCG
ncbi:MAG: GC-type dockerin domain-anchored protein [Phycisphaerales bacterium JB064]